jgi:hypothetical protein
MNRLTLLKKNVFIDILLNHENVNKDYPSKLLEHLQALQEHNELSPQGYDELFDLVHQERRRVAEIIAYSDLSMVRLGRPEVEKHNTQYREEHNP